MEIIKVRKTSTLSPFSSTDTSFTVKEFVDHKVNALVIADFDNLFVVTVRQGSTVEMVICDNLTQNDDGSATLDVATNGRDIAAKYPYTGSAIGEDFGSGAEVVCGNDPYTVYQITKAYADALAIAGAPDATTSIKGISEVATTAEVDADAADGSGDTSAPLVVTPAKLGASKYATRLPSANQKTFLDAMVGIPLPYMGDTAPTGFLLCDGTAYANDTYSALALIAKGRYGYNAGSTFTAAVTDIITATAHGLSDGDMLFFSTLGTLPAGLSLNTAYYVRDATTNTFKVSETAGGSAVDITDTGSSTHYFHTEFKVPDIRGSVIIGVGQKVKTFDFLDADVNTGTDVITVPSNQFLYTGQAVALTNSGGALPTGLSATTYYVIYVSDTTIKLATSRANADDGTAVNITAAAGGGTHTLTLTLTDRALAAEGGEESHTIQTEELASHVHSAESQTSGGGGTSGGIGSAGNTGSVGSDTPHNNMPPFLALTYIVKY